MTEQPEVNKQADNTGDELEACLGFALSMYGIHANIPALLAQTPREGGAIQPNDIINITKSLNIKAHIKQKPLEGLSNLDIPCIVLLKGRKAEVFLPAKTHQNKAFTPGTGVTEKDLARIQESYSGHVILLYPRTSSLSADDKGHIDWIWRPIQDHWGAYGEVMLSSFFINLFALVIPLYAMNVYDRVVPNFAEDTLIVLSIGIIFALIFDFLFKTIRAYILESLSSKIGTVFDFELMERLLTIQTTHMPHSLGEQANLFKEIQMLRDFYATKLAPALVDFPFFLLFLLVIAGISQPLVMVPVAAAAVILLLNLFVHVPIKKMTARHFRDMQNKSALLVETLAGAETLKMFNALGHNLFKWNVASAQTSLSAKDSNFMMAWAQNASVTIMHMVNVFIIFLGVYEIQAGNLTIGGLIACTILGARSMAPILAVGGTFSAMKRSRDVLKTMNQVFALPHEGELGKEQAQAGELKGAITFRDVSYSYPGQPVAALKDVSLTIKAGEKVGIIGKTGAGKSTIARLLTGFIKPNSGSILIDDYALDSLAPRELRQSLGIVPQKSFFFKDTLKNNVILGNEHISEKDFQKAVEVAGLDLYIKQSAQGFDADVGENGEKLSGGQQQAVALARALVKDPNVIVLDEPTNGMDYALEAKVRETLGSYLKDKTLILITHRTSLLPLVDRLILIDQGKIVADGPRDEVMKKLGG